MSKIIFPLAHPIYLTCPIRLVEQQHLAKTYNLSIEKLQSELQSLADNMRNEIVPQVKSSQKLRRAIARYLDQKFIEKKNHDTTRLRIAQLHEATAPKYAVFLRSPSGQSARFSYLHDSLESAIESCRKYAATSASHGNTDFTYYAIEIKHRVGIEHGKLVDEPLN